MRQIPLEVLPNQSLSIRLGDNLYTIELKTAQQNTVIAMFRGQTLLFSGLRAVAGAPLIPFIYLESGNFIFITENDELPFWREFGSSQKLVYLSQDEIDAL